MYGSNCQSDPNNLPFSTLRVARLAVFCLVSVVSRGHSVPTSYLRRSIATLSRLVSRLVPTLRTFLSRSVRSPYGPLTNGTERNAVEWREVK